MAGTGKKHVPPDAAGHQPRLMQGSSSGSLHVTTQLLNAPKQMTGCVTCWEFDPLSRLCQL